MSEQANRGDPIGRRFPKPGTDRLQEHLTPRSQAPFVSALFLQFIGAGPSQRVHLLAVLVGLHRLREVSLQVCAFGTRVVTCTVRVSGSRASWTRSGQASQLSV